MEMFMVLCQLVLVVLFILIILFTFCTSYLLYVHRRYSHIPGPPLNSFFTGNLQDIREMYRRNIYTHFLFMEWALQYGPLYKIFIFHKCMLIPTSQTMVKEFLTKSKYPKARVVYSGLASLLGRRFLGNGLVNNTDHEGWSHRRAALNPVFQKRYINRLIEHFNKAADDWTLRLREEADGLTTINMTDKISSTTLEVLIRVAFNMDYNQMELHKFDKALTSVLQGMSQSMRDPILRLRHSKKSFVKGVQDSVVFIRNQGRDLLREKLKTSHSSDNDICSRLLSYTENSLMTEDDMIDDFFTLLIAGHETAASCLAFLLMEVGRRPDVLSKLQAEVDDVIGMKSHISSTDLGKLEYMGWVIKETLRLYPPAPGTVREPPWDVTIEGFTIPKGSSIVVSFFILHRLESYHEDAATFKPERWKIGEPRNAFAFLPFSTGHRSCMGKHFAQMEIQILLAKLIQHFNLKTDMSGPVDIEEASSLRPRHKAYFTLDLR